MKCNFLLLSYKNNNKINLIIFISLFFLVSQFKSNDTFLSSSIQSEFEADLIKLLSKLHQKKAESHDQNLITVRIRNVFDLKEALGSILNQREMILAEKNEDQKVLMSLSEKLDKQFKMNGANLAKLKDKYDKVIEKTNEVNTQSNLKRILSVNSKSSFENEKNEFDHQNEKFVHNVVNTFKVFTGNSNKNGNEKEFSNGNEKTFSNLNEKIGTLNSNLNMRNVLQENILKIKEADQKTEIELKHLKNSKEESKMDKKLFNVINSNIENNILQLKSGFMNSTVTLSSLKKILDDKENSNKLEIEKSQQNDFYRETNKHIKDLLTKLERSQNEVKELMMRKNKLKEQLSSKEIETNIKINKLKSDIGESNKEVKNAEEAMLNNVKDQKNFLMQHEIKIKNLILIMNNLLIKVKRDSNSNSNSKSDAEAKGLINNLLFDSKIIDMNSGVNENIIKEINNSILRNQ